MIHQYCALFIVISLCPALLFADENHDTEALGDNLVVEGTPNYVKDPEDRKFANHVYFTIMAHEPNYILPFYYNFNPNRAVYQSFDPSRANYRQLEFKFQISLKVPLLTDIAQSPTSLYFAYTQLSFWQLYYASPYFRESNYKPELFFRTNINRPVPYFNLDYLDWGLVHQSNGRGTSGQRGWNRAFVKGSFSHDNLLVSIKPWYIINKNDNNSNIGSYLGHYELVASYRWGNNTFSAMSRNNLESGFKRGAVELSWSFPMLDNVRGYVQYFNGYGQNLLEYNSYSNSIGIGFSFSDWQ